MNVNPQLNEINRKIHNLEIENGKLKNISSDSIFELIRYIKDPEHPYSLERLGVIAPDMIKVYSIQDEDVICTEGLPLKVIKIEYMPTIPHCSMATLIGLCIRVKVERYIEDYWIQVYIAEGGHMHQKQINSQLNDKDRIQAALENEDIKEIIEECIFSEMKE